MKRNQQQGTGGGMVISAPGQRETVQRTERSELGTPRAQAFWLGIVGAFALAVLLADVLIIGPVIGFVAGLVAAFALALHGWRLAQELASSGMRAIAIVVGATLITAWLWTGQRVVAELWPPVRCTWPLWARGSVLLFSAAALAPCVFLYYRLAYEVVDPNWPPTIEQRPTWPGPLFPGVQADLPPDMPPQIVERVVSRPVPVSRGTPRPAQAVAQPSEDEHQIVLEQRTLIAPSGREVLITRLAEFVHYAERVGTSVSSWKARGWKYGPDWTDTVDTLAVLGIVTQRQERTGVQMLVGEREALAIIRDALPV